MKAVALLLAIFVGWVACALWNAGQRDREPLPPTLGAAMQHPQTAPQLLFVPCPLTRRNLPLRREYRA